MHPISIKLQVFPISPQAPNPSRFTVTPELIALLALQDQDEAIDGIQSKLDALAPRVAELDFDTPGLPALNQAVQTLAERLTKLFPQKS